VSSETVQELRLRLRKKFPQAHASRFPGEVRLEEGVRFSDPASFPMGKISEIVPEGKRPLLGLLLAEMLGDSENRVEIPDFVLVDGDGFDPRSFSDAACSRLLWVRCGRVEELMRAADLLIRDGNIPFVLLDTCGFPARDLGGLPVSAWWRLNQMAERSGCRVLVFSPFPWVPCAAVRWSLSSRFSLADFDRYRSELFSEIEVQPQRLRQAT